MNDPGRVYEFDTNTLLADLQAMLEHSGIDVREQTPAGVWWFHTDEAGDAIASSVTDLFGRLVRMNLREIEQ